MFVWFQDEMTIYYGTHKNCFKTDLFSWWYICINRICNNRRLIGALFQIIVIARHLLLKRLSPLVIRHWRQSLLIPGYYYIDHDGHWQWLSRAQMIFKSYTLQENCFPLQIDLPTVKVSKFRWIIFQQNLLWVFPQCLCRYHWSLLCCYQVRYLALSCW